MTTFPSASEAAGLNGRPGIQAIKAIHRGRLAENKPAKFTGSVDLDQHFKTCEPNSRRWDYGVGFKRGNVHFALWIEPHSASSKREVDVMLEKLTWLKAKLQSPGYEDLAALTEAARKKFDYPYRWMNTGKGSYRNGGKEHKRLAQKGMKLPESHIRVG